MSLPEPVTSFLFKLWDRTPWFIKWPFVVIIGPNLTVNMLVFFMVIVPWVDNRIDARTLSSKELQDEHIASVISHQAIINHHNEANIAQILQNQSMMYAELIRRNGSSQQ